MEINRILAEELGIKIPQVDAVLSLMAEGNTIPFIARYRKEVTGSLEDELLRKLEQRNAYLTGLSERMDTVLSSISEQGKLTDELKAQVEGCRTLSELEDVYRPYKPKKKTRATVAKEKGLEPLAAYISAQKKTKELAAYTEEFLDEEKGVLSVSDALQGARDIIAEQISDCAAYRAWIKKIDRRKAAIVSKEIRREEKGVYDMYADFSEGISKIAPHRILAINRGEAQKYLRVKIEAPEEEILNYLRLRIIRERSPFAEELESALSDSYYRLIAPSVENELRGELEERAEAASMEVFKENLRQLLLVAPMKGKTVMGFDPGYAHGCKIAVVDENGKVLATTVVYPTKPREQIDAARRIIASLIEKYGVDLIALGNGTASRESEKFLRELLKELRLPRSIEYVIVSEAGASVYSATALANKEFPTFDVNLRSAVSIARRLQDPLAELVKIPPESIGVGQYQHDMNQKRLREVLGGIVEHCVNTVGVDLNSASPALLEYVSGISASLAGNIVSYREANGAFTSREELLKVQKLGPKAYTQCAGFLRIRDGNPLDNTAVHPESYPIAEHLLKKLHLSLGELNSDRCVHALSSLGDLSSLCAELGVGEPTLQDIIEELKKPGRDIRESAGEPILRSDVTEFGDLKVGMILKGTVRNIMDFGCFVDIGVHDDGLVHISELSERYVKHPLDVVHVNEIVTVKVISLDEAKHRIGLSIRQAKKQ